MPGRPRVLVCLDPRRDGEEIHEVFRQAYEVEAKLLGIDDFPPLRRTLEDLRASKASFFGLHEKSRLVAVTEVRGAEARGARGLGAGVLGAEVRDGKGIVEIDGFVVQPSHFRRGLGADLLRLLLERFPGHEIRVSTAPANAPALALYRKMGFEPAGEWRTPDGISMIDLHRV